MQNELQAEIDRFYDKIRAAALLIGIRWAGSAGALAEAAGYGRFTGTKWAQRGAISPHGALRLSKLKGFPLTINEMCPGIQIDRYRFRSCPHCGHLIHPPNSRTGCSPLLKDGRYRAVKKRRAQIAKRNASTQAG